MPRRHDGCVWLTRSRSGNIRASRGGWRCRVAVHDSEELRLKPENLLHCSFEQVADPLARLRALLEPLHVAMAGKREDEHVRIAQFLHMCG